MEAIYNITRYVLPFLRGTLALVLVLTLSTCSEDPTSPEGPEVNGEINQGGDIPLHEDEGYVGLVINTRPIYKKGYVPETAAINFPNHPRFDTLITIDPFTNIAILSIHRTELTEQNSTDFANGVAVNIVITDATQQQLATYSFNQKTIDDSNLPLELETTLPYIPPTLNLEETLAYLLQPENMLGVITSASATEYSAGVFAGDSIQQQFYFTKIQGSTPNTFLIRHLGYEVNEYWYYEESQKYINLRQGDPEEFVLEPYEDGWLKIRHKNTGKFLFLDIDSDRLKLSTTVMRFRLISDINWEVEDRGTFYHQPIMGNVRASFAYSEVLYNCSAATLVTSVGLSESRSTTWSFSTKESLQLFSSFGVTAGVTIRASIKTSTGTEIGPSENKATASKEVTKGIEFNLSASYTTSSTSSTENTWSEEEQQTREVSRTRTLTVPPYNVLEVFDIIKTIDNVTVPFTQVLRVRAKDRRNNNVSLSGREIVTQLLSNLTSSAIKNIGDDFVDVTLRGDVKMDRVINAYTTVVGDSSGCN